MQLLDVVDLVAVDGHEEALADECVHFAVLVFAVPFLPARLSVDLRRLLVPLGRFAFVAGGEEHRVRGQQQLVESGIDDLHFDRRVALRVTSFSLRKADWRRHALAGWLLFLPSFELRQQSHQIAKADGIDRFGIAGTAAADRRFEALGHRFETLRRLLRCLLGRLCRLLFSLPFRFLCPLLFAVAARHRRRKDSGKGYRTFHAPLLQKENCRGRLYQRGRRALAATRAAREAYRARAGRTPRGSGPAQSERWWIIARGAAT